MPRRMLIRSVALLAWAATTIIVVAPLLMAADSGGVLPWTQWAAASACLLAVCLAGPECVLKAATAGWRPHLLALLLLLLGVYGFVQASPLPPGALSIIAPGSIDVYSGWLSPLARVPEDALILDAVRPKISVDAELTRSAAWLTLLSAGFALLASHLLVERRRIEFLLIVLAATGAVHAGLGIYQILTAADATVWGIRGYYGGKPFGAFINRSNATILLNLGLGGSIGLIGWRLAALTGTPLNGQRFPLNELFDVALDRLAVFAFFTASLSLIGLLACGSRSGLVGLVGGLLLALGMVKSANKLRTLIATAVALGLMVGIMMINLDLAALSAHRVGETAEQWLETTPADEARWGHWQDASRAAAHQPITGWGWGAYRYAYLPFQNTSAGSWFLNADNLWLEVLVETGLFGIALVGLGLWVILTTLRQLGQSVDPIDHGLAVAGWFSLGALATSQLFDFGLRIPANSLMAVILFSAVIARGCSSTRRELSSHSPSSFRFVHPLAPDSHSRSVATCYARPMTLATLATAVCVLAAATDALARQAIGDKAIRKARYTAIDPQSDLATLETAAADLSDHLQKSPANGAAWAELSQLTWHIARIKAAIDMESTSLAPSIPQRLQALSRSELRQNWYQAAPEAELTAPAETTLVMSSRPSDPPDPLAMAASEARRQAVAALVARPLSPEDRLAVLRLDFAGGDREQSSALLQQVTSLRARHTDTLLHVGDLAGESGDWSFAASCWRRATHLNPRLTSRVLGRVRRIADLRPDDVIPDHRDALRTAASIELKQAAPDPALLTRALTALLHHRQRIVASAADLHLIARIQRQLNRLDDATRTLQQATQLHPRDPELRLEYVSALIDSEAWVKAQQEVAIGQELAPRDKHFERLSQIINRQLRQHNRVTGSPP